MIKYSAPEMEIVVVETEDVILVSNDNPNGEGGLPDDNF